MRPALDPVAPREDPLRAYVRAISIRRWLVALVTLAALVGAIAFLQLRQADYEATANVLVNPLPQEDQTFLGLRMLRESGDPTRTVQTAATLLDSPEAALATARALGRGWTIKRVQDSIEVEPLGDSNILAITAVAGDARQAARLANTFTRSALRDRERQLRREIGAAIAGLRAQQRGLGPTDRDRAIDIAARINQLEATLGSGDPTLALSQAAPVPTSPAGPGAMIILPLALIAGFALGSAAALLLELGTRRVRTEEELLEFYPLPVLARVPLLPRRKLRRPRGSPWYMPPQVREAFRSIAVQLEERDRPTGMIMVSSASSGDGKTTSAVNLAVSLTAAGERVVLLDFDLRKPDIANTLRIDATERPTALLDPNAKLSGLLVPAPDLPNLQILPMATVAGDYALVEALHRRLPELIDEARERGSYVVVDTAPLGEVSDALRVAQRVDDILVISRMGNTTRDDLEAMRDLLERLGQTPTGFVVLSKLDQPSSAYYGYGAARRELFRSEKPAGARRDD